MPVAMSDENQNALETGAVNSGDRNIPDPGDNRSYSEEEVQNLLKALKSEREARKLYEKEVKEKAAVLEKLQDINPDEYRKLQEEVATAAREKAAVEELLAYLCFKRSASCLLLLTKQTIIPALA